MTIDRFMFEDKNKRDKKEKKYTEFLSNYEKKGIDYLLINFEKSTLRNLLWATENNRINLENSPGRKMWQGVMEYYQGNGSKEKLVMIKEKLFELKGSYFQQDLLAIRADLSAVLYKCLTFGVGMSYKVIDKIRIKAYHKFVNKKLYSIRKFESGSNLLKEVLKVSLD